MRGTRQPAVVEEDVATVSKIPAFHNGCLVVSSDVLFMEACVAEIGRALVATTDEGLYLVLPRLMVEERLPQP